jgi:NADH dehydrogenase [ubiquinone] 1 alpha subcomplex assembly factor 5
MTDDIILFDRQTVRRHRDRAAPAFAEHDFLHREIADQLADRLHDVKRDFATALDIGGGHGTTAFDPEPEILVTADLSENLLRQIPAGLRVSADEEFLPFGQNTFDLIASTLSLHWVNDLPGALVQIRRALKPDGLFLAAMLGGDTLIELRRAFLEPRPKPPAAPARIPRPQRMSPMPAPCCSARVLRCR